MWPTLFFVLFLALNVIGEITAPGIDLSASSGVKSIGYKVMYDENDEINEVISDVEKLDGMKSKINMNEAIKPLPARDVKCLMSVDRYCSQEMGKMKNVLIQALKEDCAKCLKVEKEEAGKVVISMMVHAPVAWKYFLTRYASPEKVQRILG